MEIAFATITCIALAALTLFALILTIFQWTIYVEKKQFLILHLFATAVLIGMAVYAGSHALDAGERALDLIIHPGKDVTLTVSKFEHRIETHEPGPDGGRATFRTKYTEFECKEYPGFKFRCEGHRNWNEKTKVRMTVYLRDDKVDRYTFIGDE